METVLLDVAGHHRWPATWTQPDFATVNVSEDGWEDVTAGLLKAGIGVEAGVDRG